MVDIEKLANILGADTVKKVYEDGASQPVQETSKILVDFIKAARLFTAPFQLLASYQDRLTTHFEKIRSSVKEENQIEAPASLSGPIIERLKYLEDNNYLTDLYINLLSRAIDKERVNEAHPAFFNIIDQLSPDEAMILYLIKGEPIYYDYTLELVREEGKRDRWGKMEIKKDTTQKEKINFLGNFEMYINHLRSLNLVYWNKTKEEAVRENKVQTHTYIETKIGLSDFGELFVKACIPEGGFIFVK